MKEFSYEHYMNLPFHLNFSKETVPPEIARRIISHAISPVITVTSTPELDKHISKSYNIDSLYMLLRFFGGCVSDRDQVNERRIESDERTESYETKSEIHVSKGLEVKASRSRRRSNSLFQRDSTQSQYIRFTRPLTDLIESSDNHDMLFDYHSLEIYLENYLKLVDKYTTDTTEYSLLKKSIYHSFFSLAISSTTNLSPYECFNHPVVSLIAIDITKGQTYEDARELLIQFKNQSHNVKNFPIFISTNDMLPVFLLCYNKDSEEQVIECEELSKRLKKQLFLESISLPLWATEYENDTLVLLHQPVMSSLDEILHFLQFPTDTKLPLKLTQLLYDHLEELVIDLLIPFMERKITFWEESILQPRKSLFHGSNKFLKRFMSKASQVAHQQQNSLTRDKEGNEYFSLSSPEFLLRKLADWSMMLSDFKSAYTTYESLIHDFEHFPKYLASCLEWCATSLLMGAQSIVTVKMIKNDIDPLIERALESYDRCAIASTKKAKQSDPNLELTDQVLSYETRCMILASELFLSLSDTWTSTPYAINYLETILAECRLGPCSQIMIWERLSDCYNLRVDPRIRHRVDNTSRIDTKSKDSNVNLEDSSIISQGLTRKRKAALFRLMAAKKWAEQRQWSQVSWCLQEIEGLYSLIGLGNRDGLILKKLKDQLKDQGDRAPNEANRIEE